MNIVPSDSANLSESVLLESKSARDAQLANVSDERAKEVLAKAKALIHFAQVGSMELATNEQIAEFYEVSVDAVVKVYQRHKHEFMADGVRTYSGKEFQDVKDIMSFAKKARHATLWTPRGALRLGMLLRDSEVAEKIRTLSLDRLEEKPNLVVVDEDPVIAQLQMLMQVRQQQVEQDRKIDAQQKLIEEQDEKIAKQQATLNEFEKVRADAHRELIALPPSSHDIPTESVDMKVRKIVNNYCAATGISQSEAFRNLYQQFYYRYRRIVKPLKSESKLQAFVRLGLVHALYDLAADIFKAA